MFILLEATSDVGEGYLYKQGTVDEICDFLIEQTKESILHYQENFDFEDYESLEEAWYVEYEDFVALSDGNLDVIKDYQFTISDSTLSTKVYTDSEEKFMKVAKKILREREEKVSKDMTADEVGELIEDTNAW